MKPILKNEFQEKEVVYEALKSGQVLTYQDNSPVDFMVDFALKKKLEEEKKYGEKEKEPSTSNLKRNAEHYDPDEGEICICFNFFEISFQARIK